MDKRWIFILGSYELKEIFYLEEENKRKSKNEKYFCCSCKEEIPVTPGSTFNHGGWRSPTIECGASLIRQREHQKQVEILYLCTRCYKTSEFEQHIAFEKKFNIPRM